jgi:YVTN family beta-propeller protein
VKRIFFVIVACSIFSACHTPTEPVIGNFPGNISAIIQGNCLGGDCHSSSTTLNTGLDLSSWEAMTKGSIYFNEIIPFSAAKSHFFGHINNNSAIAPVVLPSMPLGRDYLSETDQLAFFNWINQGAKSADGKIPYSSAANKIFVVNENEDMVSVIDAATQRLIRVLPVGAGNAPAAVAATSDKSSFIVAMIGNSGIVQKYDVASYSALGEFQSNITPGEMALTPDGTKGYITNDAFDGHSFVVFDPSGMKLLKTISTPLLIDPRCVAISPDGKYVYIGGHFSDDILRVDTHTDSIVSCLPLGIDVQIPPKSPGSQKYTPQKIVISSDSKTMYVSCENTNEVVVFDLTRDSIIARTPVNILPWGLALTPDDKELWVTAYGDSDVYVLNTATNQVLTIIDTVSALPHAITITPDGAYVYVACELSSGGAHHHATGGQPPSSYVVINRKTRKILSIQELPALSVDITIGYR